MKQAVMAGSGWEAAAVVAVAWQGLGGWRGGVGGVVDLFPSCVRPCDHAETISSSTVPLIQFIDSGWIFLSRDGYPQCKLCS